MKHYHIQHGSGKVWVNEKNPFESIDEVSYFISFLFYQFLFYQFPQFIFWKWVTIPSTVDRVPQVTNHSTVDRVPQVKLSTPQLIEYHKLNCAGMVCRLRQPLPREDSPPVVGNQFGQFNINPAEVRQSLGTQIILKDIHSYSCSVSSLVWIRCSNTSSELCLIVTNIVCH